MIPRWMHQLYAAVCGYFWTSCPLCLNYFGGHEWHSVNGLPATVPKSYGSFTGIAICPRCTADGYGFTSW